MLRLSGAHWAALRRRREHLCSKRFGFCLPRLGGPRTFAALVCRRAGDSSVARPTAASWFWCLARFANPTALTKKASRRDWPPCAPLRPLYLKLRCLRRRLSCSQALSKRPRRCSRATGQNRASAMDASPPASGAARALRSRATAATRSRRNRDAANTMLQAAHRFALHRLPR